MVDDEEWEEWDGRTPFWHHCVAGSVAGLTEHGLVFPLDTVRTHIQVCAGCPKKIISAPSSSAVGTANSMVTSIMKSQQQGKKSAMTAAAAKVGGRGATATAATELPQGMWQTIRYLVNQPVAAIGGASATTTTSSTAAQAGEKAVGITRLFRGIQTVFIGCIPAHALYFSSYEIMKAKFTETNESDHSHHLPWYGSMIAGATASTSHDCIMSPLDTVKQRLQLGHYDGSVVKALRTMVNQEGFISLYRSFPVTLLTNMPYGMIMVCTNESLKEIWVNQFNVNNHTDAGNTKLPLSTTLLASSIAGFTASACTTPLDRIKTSLQTQKLSPACYPIPKDCPILIKDKNLIVRNWNEAFQKILKEEGPVGFFRGIVPRVISHTPAVAISWTTYETAKQFLSTNFS